MPGMAENLSLWLSLGSHSFQLTNMVLCLQLQGLDKVMRRFNARLFRLICSLHVGYIGITLRHPYFIPIYLSLYFCLDTGYAGLNHTCNAPIIHFDSWVKDEAAASPPGCLEHHIHNSLLV